MPDIGEVVECHGHRFKILAVEGTRITEVAVLEQAGQQDEDPS